MEIKEYKEEDIESLMESEGIEGYDDMLTFIGVLNINPDKEKNSLIFKTGGGRTGRILVVSINLLDKALTGYKTK